MRVNAELVGDALIGWVDGTCSVASLAAGSAALYGSGHEAFWNGLMLLAGGIASMGAAGYLKGRAEERALKAAKKRGHPGRPVRSALATAAGFALGGALPLLPFLGVSRLSLATEGSGLAALLGLGAAGWAGAKLTGAAPWSEAQETMLVGSLAVAAACGVGLAARGR